MKILADIGGTHARFALEENNALKGIRKYLAERFTSLELALIQYCADENIAPGGEIAIATAAYPDGDVWRFVNRNAWTINAAALAKAGWRVTAILNDFEAATRAITTLQKIDLEILKTGKPDEKFARCLIGPGTGLGLGFLMPDGRVHNTHGGHMLASALTDEHTRIIRTVQSLKGDDTIPVFENFASGPGVFNIYRALYALGDTPPEAESPEELFTQLTTPHAKEALRLFHEFFGLFAQTVVVTGHAYGGLYLTGGVIDRLAEKNLFDFKHFEKFFVLRGVESVRKALDATPVLRVKEPHLALRGLPHG